MNLMRLELRGGVEDFRFFIENGQLGAHWDFTSAKPKRLQVAVPFAEIDAGMTNTCGVAEDGETHCWPHRTPAKWWREFESSGSD